MIARINVWRCIGCGRIEGPQPCIGVCEDRKDELVFAADHDREISRVRGEMENLAVVLRQIAYTTPHKGECERTWDALQKRARSVLETLSGEKRDGPAGN
jgi:hypothetical protein